LQRAGSKPVPEAQAALTAISYWFQSDCAERQFFDFIVCAVLMDAAPGTCLIQFESRSVSQILVAGMDDREKLRLKPCVAVIVLKSLDEKETLQLVYHDH